MLLSWDVTAAHFARARQLKEKNSTNCPIALAFQEKYGGKCGVSRSGIWTSKYGRLAFPTEVTAWIDNWDNHGRGIRPISITLQAV